MHRQTEFANERFLRRRRPEAPAVAFDYNVFGRGVRCDGELNVVGDDAYGDAVDFGYPEKRRMGCAPDKWHRDTTEENGATAEQHVTTPGQ